MQDRRRNHDGKGQVRVWQGVGGVVGGLAWWPGKCGWVSTRKRRKAQGLGSIFVRRLNKALRRRRRRARGGPECPWWVLGRPLAACVGQFILLPWRGCSCVCRGWRVVAFLCPCPPRPNALRRRWRTPHVLRTAPTPARALQTSLPSRKRPGHAACLHTPSTSATSPFIHPSFHAPHTPTGKPPPGLAHSPDGDAPAPRTFLLPPG